MLGVPTQIADSLGVGLADVGLLMTAFSATNAIGTPVILAFTGKAGPRRVMLAGLAALIVGLVATALTNDYAALVCARALKGLGHGVFVAYAYTVAQRLAEPSHEASAMANIALGFSLSQILGMPIARIATAYVSWHALYGALAVFTALAALAVAKVVPAFNQDTTDAGALHTLVEPFSHRQVRLALLATVVTQIGYMGFFTFITPYLELTFGSGGNAVSTLLLVMGIMCAIGTKASGPLSSWFGARRAVIWCLASQIVMYLVMLGLVPFLAAPVASAAPVVLACTLCLWVTVAWMFLPPQNLLLSRMAPEHVAVVIALSTSSLQLGAAMGSAVGGAFIGVAPLLLLPVLGAAFTAAGVVLEALATKGMGDGRPGGPGGNGR